MFRESSKQTLFTPQSIWVKFKLPKSLLPEDEADGLLLTLTVEADMGSDVVPLIVSERFKLPADDLETLLQSHREGL